ncbi:hypothetical protein [Shewanella maritima]|uniref:hypothetical protein n=1 Tax=Shewanella maritima TaxID=2520507 RepID=UPI0037353086
MKIFAFIIYILLSKLSFASESITFSEQIASDYARTSIEEWSFVSGYKIEPDKLLVEPTILKGVDQTGSKIVMVLFPSSKGSYQVTFTVNKDGYLDKQGVGAWIYTISEIKEQFEQQPFVPEA